MPPPLPRAETPPAPAPARPAGDASRPAPRRRALRLASLALAPALGCSLLRPLDDLEPGPAGVAGRAGAAGAEAGGAGPGGAAGGGDVGGAGGAGGGRCRSNADCADAGTICKEKRGQCEPCPPEMAFARFQDGPGFCIDIREVKQTEYDEFLVDVASGVVPVVPPGCEANRAFDPAGDEPEGANCRALYRPGEAGALPVTCVDFCDAAAYCGARGKQLCGDRQGEALTELSSGLLTNDQWLVACAGPAPPGRAFPYGDAFDALACNVNRELEGAVESGTYARCRTDAGAFDLSGNVAEWVNGCTEGGAEAQCSIRGGSYLTQKPDLAGCAPATGPGPDEARAAPRNARRASLGIRCCAD